MPTSSALLLAVAAALVAAAAGFGVARRRGRERLREARRREEAAEAARSLAEAAARDAEEARTQFLSGMSHEIRTPLNGIAGLAALLLELPLPPDVRQHVETIRGSSDTLITSLDDLLDLDRLESGQWEPQAVTFAPAATLAEAFAILSAQARTLQKRFTPQIRPSVPAWASGDPARLRQLVVQMAGHALAFTDRSEVQLSVAARPLDAFTTELTLTVSDHGEGSQKVPKGRLFDSLRRSLPRFDGRLSGPEVSLAIARKVCERLGGQIQIDSDTTFGTTVRLSLRLGPASAPVQPPEPPVNPAAARCAILLVEDNPVNQRVASAMLTHMGYKADLANNGQEALDAAARRAYDIILMDVQMPVMDGLEASRRIVGGAHRGPRPWIIAVTANTMPGDRELCLRAGMNDYVPKPLKPPVLREALERGLAAKPDLGLVDGG